MNREDMDHKPIKDWARLTDDEPDSYTSPPYIYIYGGIIKAINAIYSLEATFSQQQLCST